MIARALVLWMAIIPIAVLNGIFREKVLVPRLGLSKARTTSGLSLIAFIVAFSLATMGWLPRMEARGYLLAGALWLIWTVAFEFGFGRWVARKPWSELLGAYTCRDGDIWPLVLAVIGASPWIAAVALGLIIPRP